MEKYTITLRNIKSRRMVPAVLAAIIAAPKSFLRFLDDNTCAMTDGEYFIKRDIKVRWCTYSKCVIVVVKIGGWQNADVVARRVRKFFK